MAATAAEAQHREYYVRGKVVDTARQPIAGVQIRLLDTATSRDYRLKTDREGRFKLAGLPHGTYEASFAKDGYAAKQDTWNFATPQDTMQRVDVPDVVLASATEVQAAQQRKEAQSAVKDALEKIRAGDLDAAIQSAEAVLRKDPADTNARFLLGTAYLKKKMYAEAAAALAEVTRATPAFAPAYFELGLAHRSLGDAARALEAYDKGLALDPANADGAYNAGLILFETGRVPEARARFQAGLAVRPGDPDLLEMAARCHIHEGNLAAAVELLRKARAATTDPDKAAVLDRMIEGLEARPVR
jgi:tetratricopeptide (TPR) repeat protein